MISPNASVSPASNASLVSTPSFLMACSPSIIESSFASVLDFCSARIRSASRAYPVKYMTRFDSNSVSVSLLMRSGEHAHAAIGMEVHDGEPAEGRDVLVLLAHGSAEAFDFDFARFVRPNYPASRSHDATS